jgi:two-component system, LuxR family, response regulator FixJ
MSVSSESRVYVVDDDADVRDSLSLLLGSVGLDVRTFDSAVAFLGGCGPEDAGCIILDVRMPGMSGPQLQEKLAGHGILMPVIILTGHADVPTAVRTLKAGAFDLLEKPVSDQDLIDRVNRALELDDERRREERERAVILDRMGSLSARERQVMEAVVAGRLNKLIAADLGLSTRTVEIHRARIMQKMHADSLSDLVRMAMVAGIEVPSH